jgi:hypothetical protein
MLNFNEAVLTKAKQANSVEELLTLAKENNIELTVEQAKEYFAQLNPQSDELADCELDSVVGGAVNESQIAPWGITLITPLQEENGNETKSSNLKFPANTSFT